jgi:hypothetical protein
MTLGVLNELLSLMVPRLGPPRKPFLSRFGLDHSREPARQHPGGMPDGSRGLSEAIPPGTGITQQKFRTLKGLPENQVGRQPCWHPAGVHEFF